MQTLSEIRRLLAERGLRPKHRLGQNFLHDKNQLTKLIDAAELRAGDLVLEVGPGTGTLTSALLERGAEVIACELDDDMNAIIREQFARLLRGPASVEPDNTQIESLTLVRGDVLERDRRLNPEVVNAIGDRDFKLIANLPYQIASPLMSSLLTDHPKCIGQYVTIQKEVADRLLAKPGTKEYGVLTIIVQALANVRRIATLSPSCFWPPPDVTSAMVALVPRRSEASLFRAGEQPREFARFITELFSKRRKQLGTIFGRDRVLWPQGVKQDLRPEALDVNQLIELWRTTP